MNYQAESQVSYFQFWKKNKVILSYLNHLIDRDVGDEWAGRAIAHPGFIQIS